MMGLCGSAAATDCSGFACPNDNLKGVNLILYSAVTEGMFDDHALCDVDWKSLTTAVAFIANQSTKLELISFDGVLDKVEQLNHIRDDGKGHYSVASSASEDERRRSHQLTWAPTLNIFVTTMHGGGNVCLAHIEMVVEAKVEASKYYHNGKLVYGAKHFLWKSSYFYRTQREGHEKEIMQAVENKFKKFINDWSDSQRLD
jgi:hypothetical protein